MALALAELVSFVSNEEVEKPKRYVVDDDKGKVLFAPLEALGTLAGTIGESWDKGKLDMLTVISTPLTHQQTRVVFVVVVLLVLLSSSGRRFTLHFTQARLCVCVCAMLPLPF